MNELSKEKTIYEDNEIIRKKIGFFTVTYNKKEEQKRLLEKEKNEMFYYIIKDLDNNRYKLGVTKNIKNRMINIKTNCSKGIELILSEKILHAFKKEADIKNKLKKYKHHGEWFELDDEIIQFITIYIKEIKNKRG